MAEKITIISSITDLRNWVNDRAGVDATPREINDLCDIINADAPPYGADWQDHFDDLPEDLLELLPED